MNRPSAPQAPVPQARVKRRHLALFISFVICVVLPALLVTGYLFLRAADQFSSTVAFSVRTEDFSSPLDVLGGLGQLSSGSSSDTDILYDYIRSQKLVEDLQATLDLRSIYATPQDDPVFGFSTDASIEDLVDHWGRMVHVNYDPGTGLIEIETRAFDPQSATRIATAIFEQSSLLINELSVVARHDATEYAREDLAMAASRLKDARIAVTTFRNTQQVVDPAAALEARSGILAALEAELASALIEGDLLRETTRTGDPRLAQTDRRISAIETRINAERQKVGRGTSTEESAVLTEIVGEYEGLLVDREFAEQAYVSALATYDQALAEARRKSRYLAAHVPPTTAQTSTFPNRPVMAALAWLFLSLLWALLCLIAYSIRDRR